MNAYPDSVIPAKAGEAISIRADTPENVPYPLSSSFSSSRSDADAAEVDGEVLGVAEEVGVGRQDLEFFNGGHGADQEIDG